jgi:[acyl-carrier-protein] S-malonyltransferase
MTFAVVFPGQGSQSVGMLADLAKSEPLVRETFDSASTALDYDLWRLISEGPADDLNATEHTQPALLAAGIAVWRVWRDRGGAEPAWLAGHSLGEYTALVAAGSIGFDDAIALVAFRGRAMQAAVPAGSGAMAAILGLDDDAVRAACREAAGPGDIVAAASFNAPGQVVISGHSLAVERATEAARAAGAKRALVLPVSVPSHCELMHPAAAQLADRLRAARIDSPAIPVIHNCDVTAKSAPEAIREALVAQLDQPVLWADSVREMAARGVERLLEFGPGKVLTGLTRRIERSLSAGAVNDPASLDKALEESGATS